MTRHQTPFTRPVGSPRSAPAQDRSRPAEAGAAAPVRAPRPAPAAAAASNAGALELPTGPVTQTSSEALFAGAVEIQIDHHGTIYRLKHTALGKLILTK